MDFHNGEWMTAIKRQKLLRAIGAESLEEAVASKPDLSVPPEARMENHTPVVEELGTKRITVQEDKVPNPTNEQLEEIRRIKAVSRL